MLTSSFVCLRCLAHSKRAADGALCSGEGRRTTKERSSDAENVYWLSNPRLYWGRWQPDTSHPTIARPRGCTMPERPQTSGLRSTRISTITNTTINTKRRTRFRNITSHWSDSVHLSHQRLLWRKASWRLCLVWLQGCWSNVAVKAFAPVCFARLGRKQQLTNIYSASTCASRVVEIWSVFWATQWLYGRWRYVGFCSMLLTSIVERDTPIFMCWYTETEPFLMCLYTAYSLLCDGIYWTSWSVLFNRRRFDICDVNNSQIVDSWKDSWPLHGAKLR